VEKLISKTMNEIKIIEKKTAKSEQSNDKIAKAK
jgi:hypothetical protein